MLSDHERCGKNAGGIVSTNTGLKHLIPAGERNRPEPFFFPELGSIIKVFIASPNIVDKNIQLIMFESDTLKQGFYFFVIHMVATDGNTFAALSGYFFCRLIDRTW